MNESTPLATTGTKVWVLTSEGDELEPRIDCGCFTSKDNALRFLAKDYIGDKLASSIEWEQSPDNAEFFEGVSSVGTRYVLYTEVIDKP